MRLINLFLVREEDEVKMKKEYVHIAVHHHDGGEKKGN